MLILKRRDGEWIDVRHVETGDLLRVRLYDFNREMPNACRVAFDDEPRNFEIQRPERPEWVVANERLRRQGRDAIDRIMNRIDARPIEPLGPGGNADDDVMDRIESRHPRRRGAGNHRNRSDHAC